MKTKNKVYEPSGMEKIMKIDELNKMLHQAGYAPCIRANNRDGKAKVKELKFSCCLGSRLKGTKGYDQTFEEMVGEALGLQVYDIYWHNNDEVKIYYEEENDRVIYLKNCNSLDDIFNETQKKFEVESHYSKFIKLNEMQKDLFFKSSKEEKKNFLDKLLYFKYEFVATQNNDDVNLYLVCLYYNEDISDFFAYYYSLTDDYFIYENPFETKKELLKFLK